MKTIYSIIPARGGSKGVPGKNIRLLNGHPLIAYSIMASKLSKNIQRTIVSTDSKEIADIAKNYGAEVPFLRPADKSGDNATDYEFFKHAIEWFEENEGKVPEYFVHLRPTTPLRDITVIDKGIEYMLSKPEATGMRSVHRSSISCYKVFEMEGSYLKGCYPDEQRIEYYNLPRQFFPQIFVPNGYVDVVRTSVIKTGLLHGDKLLGYVTAKVPDIDIYEDFKNAEKYLYEKQFKELINYLEKTYE